MDGEIIRITASVGEIISFSIVTATVCATVEHYGVIESLTYIQKLMINYRV